MMGVFFAVLGITAASALLLFLCIIAVIYWNRMRMSVNNRKKYIEHRRMFGVILMILTPYALLCLAVIAIFVVTNFIR